MGSVRKLPSGKHQGVVRNPVTGKRETRAFLLKRDAKTWADEREAQLRRGAVQDPRRGAVTVREWHEMWWAARVVEDSTRRGDESMLRNHVLPEWGSWKLSGISRLEVQRWVRDMERKGAQPQTVRRAYNLTRTMLQAAVDDDRLTVNPCSRITLPRIPERPPAFFTREQVDAILKEAREPHRTITLLMCWTGLRWQEAAALRADRVDFLRRRVQVVDVMTQAGKIKEYPKTSKSRREVPVPQHVLDELARTLQGRPRDGLVFVTPRGERNLSGSNYRKEWESILQAAGVDYLPPHTCRHTAASWLVQAGVPLMDVMRLLGHSSIQTTLRYAHLAPDSHEKVTGAWDQLVEAQKAAAEKRDA